MWMAGVCGWIILVCEAMIAVPFWMLAHMTVGGDGLHGRAIEGWSLLFNIVFRPTLMVSACSSDTSCSTACPG